MSDKLPDNWLHIYGQYTYHDAACIRGTKGGLEALRSAIDKALVDKEAEADVFATDGEGYSVKIQLSNTINGLGTPEYISLAEMKIWEQSVERWTHLGRPTSGWEASKELARLEELRSWWKEPATKTDYVFVWTLAVVAFSVIVLWR